MAYLPFSDTTNKTGIIQLIERTTNTQSATTASYPLGQKTQDVNDALGNYALIATKASGRMQWDDTNQTDYPVIKTDIVQGQVDYTFTLDGSTPQNQILDVRQVRIKDPTGLWKILPQIDRQTDDISKYQNITGIPEAYDLDSNGVRLYPISNYNSTSGIEFYVSRTPSYFASTDTTKEAGIPKIFQSYLYLRPSYLYCLIKNLPQLKGLQTEVLNLEKSIADYYSRRYRVEKPGMRVTNSSGNYSANSNR